MGHGESSSHGAGPPTREVKRQADLEEPPDAFRRLVVVVGVPGAGGTASQVLRAADWASRRTGVVGIQVMRPVPLEIVDLRGGCRVQVRPEQCGGDEESLGRVVVLNGSEQVVVPAV